MPEDAVAAVERVLGSWCQRMLLLLWRGSWAAIPTAGSCWEWAAVAVAGEHGSRGGYHGCGAEPGAGVGAVAGAALVAIAGTPVGVESGVTRMWRIVMLRHLGMDCLLIQNGKFIHIGFSISVKYHVQDIMVRISRPGVPHSVKFF